MLPKVAKCCQKLHSALHRCPLVNAAGSLFHMHLHRKYNLLLHACRAKAVLKILSGSGNPAVQANYIECCRLTVHKMSPCTQVKLSVQMWIKRSRVFILYAPPQKIQPFSACLPGESRAFAVQCSGNPAVQTNSIEGQKEPAVWRKEEETFHSILQYAGVRTH